MFLDILNPIGEENTPLSSGVVYDFCAQKVRLDREALQILVIANKNPIIDAGVPSLPPFVLQVRWVLLQSISLVNGKAGVIALEGDEPPIPNIARNRHAAVRVVCWAIAYVGFLTRADDDEETIRLHGLCSVKGRVREKGRMNTL